MRSIALVGHSGAGKSACLNLIYGNEGNARKADMDYNFDTRVCPSLLETEEWMINNDRRIFVVSNHFNMLEEIAKAKEEGTHNDLFNHVFFVRLYAEYNVIEQRLLEQDGYSQPRNQQNIGDVLKGYHDIDKLFRRIQDRTIDTSTKDIATVADEVINLSRTI